MHNDDMDICFRAASVGRKVYAILMDVENDSMSVGAYDPNKSQWYAELRRKSSDLLYSRWQPSPEKDYLWVQRTPILGKETTGETVLRMRQRSRRRYLAARRRWLHAGRIAELAGGAKRRLGV